MPDIVFLCAITVWSVALARVDFREHRLPDRLTFPAIPLALVSVAWMNPSSLAWATATAIVVFAVAFLAHQVADLGLGDVKLLPAVAIVAANSPNPAENLAEWFVSMAILGGIHAAIHLVITRDPRSHIPFGPAILGGVLWATASG